MQTTSITITADAGDQVDLGGFGVAWKIEGASTGERFSVVHHPILRGRWSRLSTGTRARTSTPM
jgi:hypothetical protein